MNSNTDPPAGMGAPASDPEHVQSAGNPPPIQASLPVNRSPEWLVNVLYDAGYFVQAYGWFIVFAAALLYFLWTRVRDRFYALKDEMNARQQAKAVDPAVLAARQESMAAARERMQRATDEQAAQYAQKQVELEDRKRQERIEDWDRQQLGKGPRSRTLRSNAADDEATGGSSSKPRRRPLRPDNDYSPLMGGGGGGGGYRPSRSRPGGMGGG